MKGKMHWGFPLGEGDSGSSTQISQLELLSTRGASVSRAVSSSSYIIFGCSTIQDYNEC